MDSPVQPEISEIKAIFMKTTDATKTTTAAPTISNSILLRISEVERLCKYKKSWIKNAEKGGHFPRSLKLGPGRTVWRLQDIEDWLNSKVTSQLHSDSNSASENE
jgi:predicted DNA-binding transcriptional regulator AlpA